MKNLPEFQHRFAHTNGIRMHYVEAGAGPLVIFCHGFPELWYSWRHQLRAFAEAGFRAIAPDQRGYGESDAPAPIEAYDLCHLAGDIVGLLYDLNETRAIIIGHDWGAAVAWTCALLRPDLFYGLGLLSVPYLQKSWGGPRPTETMRSRVGDALDFYQLYFQREGIAEAELEQDARRSLLGMYYSASGEAPPEKRWRTVFSRSERLIDTMPAPDFLPAFLTESDLEYYTQQFVKSGFRGPLNWYRNIDRNAETLAFLKNAAIVQESIFVAGEKDGVIDMYRDAYDSLETFMPRLQQKVLIPGAGHWVQQEHPETVARLLLDFCTGLQGERTQAANY
jgi:pimeloyl-ACP methyl ester carboxylesterase